MKQVRKEVKQAGWQRDRWGDARRKEEIKGKQSLLLMVMQRKHRGELRLRERMEWKVGGDDSRVMEREEEGRQEESKKRQ